MLKKLLPTLGALGTVVLASLVPAVGSAIQSLATTHPQLAGLLGVLWVAVANYVESPKTASAPAAPAAPKPAA